jgi:hypothetical protein
MLMRLKKLKAEDTQGYLVVVVPPVADGAAIACSA